MTTEQHTLRIDIQGNAEKKLAAMNREMERTTKSTTRLTDGLSAMAGGGGQSAFKAIADTTGEVTGAFGGLSETINIALDVLWPLTTAFKAVAYPIGIAGVALTAFTAKSLHTFLTEAESGKAAVEGLGKEFQELEMSVGGAMVGFTKGRTILDAFDGVISDLAKNFRQNYAPTVFEASRTIVSRIVQLVQVGVSQTSTMLRVATSSFLQFTESYGEILKGALSVTVSATQDLIAMLRPEIQRQFGLDRLSVGLSQLQTQVTANINNNVASLRDGAVQFTDVINQIEGSVNQAGARIQGGLANATLGTYKPAGEKAGGKAAVDETAEAWKRLGETLAMVNAHLNSQAMDDMTARLSSAVDDVRANMDQIQQDAIDSQFESYWQSVTDTMVNGAMDIGFAFADMAAAMAMGTMSAREFGAEALTALGGYAKQVGRTLVLGGTGLGALFAGNPAGAIGAGAALYALGTLMSAGGSAISAGSQGGSSNAGSQLREFGRRMERQEDDRLMESTVNVYVGTRQIAAEIQDINRRARP